MGDPTKARQALQGLSRERSAEIVPACANKPTTRTGVSAAGKRQSFRNIRRQLYEIELASPGVQKLILEELDKAEAQCETLQGFVERYHDADKRAAVLEEKLNVRAPLENLSAVGLAVGTLILGLVPTFWDGTAKGPALLAIGTVLAIISAVARVKRQ